MSGHPNTRFPFSRFPSILLWNKINIFLSFSLSKGRERKQLPLELVDNSKIIAIIVIPGPLRTAFVCFLDSQFLKA